MGCFVYTIFGTSKDITLGPTAILSLLTASLTWGCGPSDDPDDTTNRIKCAIALTFLSGAIQFAVGLLNLGEHCALHASNLVLSHSRLHAASLKCRGWA